MNRSRRWWNRARSLLPLLVLVLVALWGATAGVAQTPGSAGTTNPAAPAGLEKLDHLIFIVQENRSFDHYFGSYPGANGIPTKPDGSYKPCIPHPVLKCVRPFDTNNPVNIGGPHSHGASVIAMNHGRMNGFVKAAIGGNRAGHCIDEPKDRRCRKFNGPHGEPDLMSVMDRGDIPNYWAYADNFVLQDRFFEGVDSWSLPAHMYLMSAWSANCKSKNPMSCHSDPSPPGTKLYPWTDITYLLEQQGITWAYYVGNGTNLQCSKYPCNDGKDETATPSSWNPVPQFITVRQNHNFGNLRHQDDFFSSVQNGTLPQVTWLIPAGNQSEHPGHGTMARGPGYVTKAINTIMESQYWDTSAIFLHWDDWGGFFDHMDPPKVDGMGYGIRVPALVIGPYAKDGYIDHQTYSSDAYLKLIEDVFLAGQRLDPKTDGRPDSRPSVRENEPILGDLSAAFDFNQAPRPPLILNPDDAWGHTASQPIGWDSEDGS